MPRPIKKRRVCNLPRCKEFGPITGEHELEPVIMSVDEYETIRLIDFEGYNQEECANQMNVARTTVQGIYTEARKKLAISIVQGNKLIIEGGKYHLCDSFGVGVNPHCCSGGKCCKRRGECHENNITSE